MLAANLIRNAATISIKRSSMMAASVRPTTLGLRTFATENNDTKNDEKKEESSAEETKVELTEEVKKMLAEKDKQIAEIKVYSEKEKRERESRFRANFFIVDNNLGCISSLSRWSRKHSWT